MIVVKFLGGAKKSFNSDQLKIDESDIPIRDLLELLLKLKPRDTSDLDFENILIAVNGSDSSAQELRHKRFQGRWFRRHIPRVEKCLIALWEQCWHHKRLRAYLAGGVPGFSTVAAS